MAVTFTITTIPLKPWDDEEWFSETARLIAGEESPRWLPKLLVYWSRCIRVTVATDGRRLSRKEVVRRIATLIHNLGIVRSEASDRSVIHLSGSIKDPISLDLLLMEISSACTYQVAEKDRPPALVSFISAIDKTREVLQDARVMSFVRPDNVYWECTDLDSVVLELIDRSNRALRSNMLVKRDGKASSGSGKAVSPLDLCPRTLTAAIVQEIWSALHDEPYPAPSNKTLAKAADELFRASGGMTKLGWGTEHLNSWIPYFKAVDEPKYVADRKEVEREVRYSLPFGGDLTR